MSPKVFKNLLILSIEITMTILVHYKST